MFRFREQNYINNAQPIFPKKDRGKYKNDIHILRVWASDWDGHTRGFPTRDIGIRGSSNLDKLAEMVTTAFDFDMDHLYDFSDNIKRNKVTEKYKIYFEDEDEDINAPYTDNIIISQIFDIKKKMIFLFDYGDMWYFVIQCKEIREPRKSENKFPYAFNIKGEAPEQYSDYEDYE